MYRQRSIRALMGLLALGIGCTNDEVRVEGESESESTDATTTDDGADPTTTDDPDGGSTNGGEGGSEGGTSDGGGLHWGPVVNEDEIGVEPVPMQRPTPGRWPVAAFGDNQYLAVWEDHRTRRPALYGGRVAADGTALDPLGFPILEFPIPMPDPWLQDEYEPSVAFDGVNFLIVTRWDGQVLGVRVSAAGEVLDPGGFLIADAAYGSVHPSVLFDGDQYMVAWGDEGIYRARVQPDGTVLDPGGELVYAMDDSVPVSLSFDGTNDLLSWTDYDDQLQSSAIFAGRMAPDGTLIDQDPILIKPIWTWFYSPGQPASGFDGTNHVLAWIENGESDQGEEYRVFVARVTPDATVLDPDGILIATESVEATHVHRVELDAGNGRSQVVWSEDYSGEGGPGSGWIRGARIATDGTVSMYDEEAFGFGLEATVTVHPDGALLLWRHGDHLSRDYPAITGTLLDGADMPVPDAVVAPASPASRQDVRAVASDGQNFFVVWLDTRVPDADGRALFGARVGAYGEPLDPEPILIRDWHTDMADVVFDGANYVVTWVYDSGGEGSGTPFESVRVSPAGEVLDMQPIESGLKGDYGTFAGASDGTHTLLVGADNHYYQNMEIELAAALLNQNGQPSDVIPILVNSELYELQTSVSFDGLGYLVVWSSANEDGISGQRINPAGELEGGPFAIVDKDPMHMVSAAGGGVHLVVWDEYDGVWATRVGPGGQVLDPGGILVAAVEPGSSHCEWDPEFGTGACASVVFDGENFMIAWRAASMLGDWSSLDAYAARVSPNGDVSPQFVISQEPDGEGPPVLASNEDGRVLAAYSRFVPGGPFDTRRAMARLLMPE